MVETYKKAAKGLRLVFAAQIIALIMGFFAEGVAMVIGVAMTLVGLRIAASAHKLYRIAFWLTLLCLAPIAMALILYSLSSMWLASAESSLVLSIFVGLFSIITFLSEAVQYGAKILTICGTARVLRESGDERHAHTADLCWKWMLGIIGTCFVLALVMLGMSALNISIGSEYSFGIAMLAGAPLLIGSAVIAIAYLVVLYQGYSSLDDTVKRLSAPAEEIRAEPQTEESAKTEEEEPSSPGPISDVAPEEETKQEEGADCEDTSASDCEDENEPEL